MGGSRRRKKNHQSSHLKVRVGLPRTKPRAAPKEVTLPGVPSTTWDNTKTQTENYKAIGLFSDPRLGTGRNRKVKTVTVGKKKKKKEAAPQEEEDMEEEEEEEEEAEPEVELTEEEKQLQAMHDDELKGAMGEARSTMRAPPKLTTTQRRVMAELVRVHGGNIAAMARDRKLNRMQHTEGKLRLLVEGYLAYPHLEGGGARSFHAPKKRC